MCERERKKEKKRHKRTNTQINKLKKETNKRIEAKSYSFLIAINGTDESVA